MINVIDKIQYNPALMALSNELTNVDVNQFGGAFALNGLAGLGIRTAAGFVTGAVMGQVVYERIVRSLGGGVPFELHPKQIGAAAEATKSNFLIEHVPHTVIPTVLLEATSKIMGNTDGVLDMVKEVASINSPMLPFESVEMLGATAVVAAVNSLVFTLRHNYGRPGSRLVNGAIIPTIAATWGPIPAMAYHFGYDASIMMRT